MNRSRVSTVKWNLFFHYFTVAYAIISGIALVPLYLKYIPLDLYGGWLATSNIIAWLSIVDPGVSSVVMQRISFSYGQKDSQALNGLITNGICLSLVLALLICAIGLIVAPLIFSVLNLSDTQSYLVLQTAFTIAIFGTALMVLSYGFTAINMGFQSSLGIGLIFAITNLSSLVVIAVLLYLGIGVLALPWALVFRGAGLSLGNAAYMFWRLRTEPMQFRVSFQGLRELVAMLSYTFWGKAMDGIAGNMDALLIARFLGPEVVPILSLTRKAPDLSRTFLERPAMAFMPAISHLFGSGDVKRTQEILLRLLRMIIWLMGLAVVGFLLLNEPFVRLWVGAKLYAGSTINMLIVLGLVVTVVVSVLSNLCYSLGNIKGNSLTLMAQSFVSIFLMYFGGQIFGMAGVVLAPTIAMVVVSGWYYPRAFIRLLNLTWGEVKTLLYEFTRVAAAALLVGVSFTLVNPLTWLEFISVSVALVASYVVTLTFISTSLRRELVTLWTRIK